MRGVTAPITPNGASSSTVSPRSPLKQVGCKSSIPGVLRATNSFRRHVAVVKIEFSTTAYSIQYESSDNLLHRIGYPESSFPGQVVIHRNYNNRVRQLEFEIERWLYGPAS